MSEQALSLIITVVIIALLFAWVPFLNFVCPLAAAHSNVSGLERQKETHPGSTWMDVALSG